MLKLLIKKWVFYFFISFLITFVVGFFVWFIFVGSNISFFTAGLLSGYKTDDIVLTDLEKEETIFQDLPPDTDLTDLELDENVINEQDLLDNIQEKIDIIKQQVQELIAEQNQDDLAGLKKEDEAEGKKIEDKKEDDLKLEGLEEYEEIKETVSCIGQININTASEDNLEKIISVGPVTAQKIIESRPFYSLNDLLKVGGIGEKTLKEIIEQNCAYVEPGLAPPSGGGGGVSALVYPKVLISEVQISPIEQRFIELYNPNNVDVNLTDWYLQRKTETADSWSSLVSSTKFQDKIILANSYFLISREDPEGTPNSDILLDITLSSGNSLALKNPNGEISDEITWLEITEGISWCADFALCTPTPKAQNITYVVPPAPTDTTPPEVTFNLDVVQNALDFMVDFTIIDIDDTVTPSGLESYIFRWQQEGNDWQEDSLQEILGAPLSIDLIKTVSGSDGQVFNFQAKATDVAGNTSSWLPEVPVTTTITLPTVQQSILINEVQIAGQTTRDEFVELYNPNSFDVDLSRFSLKKKTSGGTESNLVSSGSFAGIITSLGYFLIVPQDNDDGTLNYMGTELPDLLYSGISYSIASNNTILLYDSSDTLSDKVGFGTATDFETASAQDPDAGKSISRVENTDTDDNGVDFIILDIPTPRAE